jgi:dihydroorotate dehydrogenase
LVQLYTALVFTGPHLVSEIKKDLADLLIAGGFASIADAIGSGQDGAAARPTRFTQDTAKAEVPS